MPLNQALRKNSNVLWTISIIQDQNPEAQTKAEFSEMTNDVVNTPNVENLTLCLADNLQRFRLMIQHGISEEEAIAECQKLSSQWNIDNSESVESLKKSKNFSVLTWKEFLDWPNKDKTISDIEKLYEGKPEFKVDVDTRIRQVRDSLKNPKISDTLEQTILLRKYLIEELAFQKFCASKGFNYEIYKTQCCKAMRRIKNNTDFVPTGLMREMYFTQFNQPVKNNSETNQSIIRAEKESFSSVFNKKPYQSTANNGASMSIKFAEFIEKTLQMVPVQEQERAVDALMKFTAQEILPLCYSNKSNTLKI
jgi:hypothetical protein